MGGGAVAEDCVDEGFVEEAREAAVRYQEGMQVADRLILGYL